MFKKIKNFSKSNPMLTLAVMMVVFAPKQASAVTFISQGLSDSKAQAVIQVLGGLAIAYEIVKIFQSFISGGGSAIWERVLGVIVGIILVVQPSLLGTTLASFGL